MCTVFPTACHSVLDHIAEGLERVAKSRLWCLRITGPPGAPLLGGRAARFTRFEQAELESSSSSW